MNRLVGFQGVPALLLKIAVMGIVNAIAVTVLIAAVLARDWGISTVLGLALVGLNFVYFRPGRYHMKFLYPGLVFLIAFIAIPVAYTVLMSTFNFKTGNETTKARAIVGILDRSFSAAEDGANYDMVLGRDSSGELTALLTDMADQTSVLLASEKRVVALEPGQYTTDEFGVAQTTEDFTALTPQEIAANDAKIVALRFTTPDGRTLGATDPLVAVELIQTYQWDPATETFTNIETGARYQDNGNGNFASLEDPEDKLEPGWRAFDGLGNFARLFGDEKLRDPFIKVFIWTIAFAFLSVFTTFVVGLALAIAMDRPIRGRRMYRSILILPYAIPSFMSILVWSGLFNRDFGAINAILNAQIGWFEDPWLARGAILLVNLWLGFPYMYLISSGALQSIPSELTEAAQIDGANAWQRMSQVTLPLLLQVLSPLLIASFAFNFNNFNIIYLLTGGGPTNAVGGEVAGATDILISYAYKTAVSSNFRDYGLSSAISVIMFLIVGALSLWSLRRSRVLESV